MTALLTIYRLKEDSKANWLSNNPILKRAEPGYEYDTTRMKVGDGISRWTQLLYQFETLPSVSRSLVSGYSLAIEDAGYTIEATTGGVLKVTGGIFPGGTIIAWCQASSSPIKFQPGTG